MPPLNITDIDVIARSVGLTADAVLDAMATAKKKKVLEDHTHDIWQNERTGRWVTYITTEEGGRKQISSKDKKTLEQKIYEHYVAQEDASKKESLTLRTLFPEWIKYKSRSGKGRKPQTLKRNRNDWKRYYESSDIIDIPLTQLSRQTITTFLYDMIDAHQMGRHQFGNFSLIIRQMLRYAEDQEYISRNPMDKVKVDWSSDLQIEEEKPDEELIFYPHEARRMIDYCWDQYHAGRQIVQIYAPLAVVFCFYTGLRVSELSAAKFSDVHKTETGRQVIVVQRMVDDTGETVIRTKSGRPREVKLPSEAVKVIDEIRKDRKEKGLPEDYIFAIGEPKSAYKRIQKVISVYCQELDMIDRSMHDVRRTYSSMCSASGMHIKEVMDAMGHKQDITTYRSYIRSIKQAKEQHEDFENALQYE